MPNIKSQMKRLKISERQRQRNRSVKTALRTTIKKFYAASETGDQEAARAHYAEAARALDKAASRGVIHKNKAANKKSRMARDLNGMT